MQACAQVRKAAHAVLVQLPTAVSVHADWAPLPSSPERHVAHAVSGVVPLGFPASPHEAVHSVTQAPVGAQPQAASSSPEKAM